MMIPSVTIAQPDDAFHAAAKLVMKKNADLYRRLS